MKITDLLKRESVELSGTPESKGQAIDQMVELMAKGGNINDLQRYKEGVLKRRGRNDRDRRGNCHSSCKDRCRQCTGACCDAGSSGCGL